MKGGAERAQRAKRNLGLMSKMVKVGPQNSRKMVKVAAHVDRCKTVKVPTLQKPNPHPMPARRGTGSPSPQPRSTPIHGGTGSQRRKSTYRGPLHARHSAIHSQQIGYRFRLYSAFRSRAGIRVQSVSSPLSALALACAAQLSRCQTSLPHLGSGAHGGTCKLLDRLPVLFLERRTWHEPRASNCLDAR